MFDLDGTYEVSIDDKGRARLPARMLSQLGEEHGQHFFINRGSDGVLLRLYPLAQWENEKRWLRELSYKSPKEVRILRHYFSQGQQVDLDPNSRISIPQVLIEHLGIKGKGKIRIETFLDFIEIYNAEEPAQSIPPESIAELTNQVYQLAQERLADKENEDE